MNILTLKRKNSGFFPNEQPYYKHIAHNDIRIQESLFKLIPQRMEAGHSHFFSPYPQESSINLTDGQIKTHVLYLKQHGTIEEKERFLIKSLKENFPERKQLLVSMHLEASPRFNSSSTLSLLVQYGSFEAVSESWNLVSHQSQSGNFYNDVLPLAISHGNFDLALKIMACFGRNQALDRDIINGLLLAEKQKLRLFIALKVVKLGLIEALKKCSSQELAVFVLKVVQNDHIELAEILFQNGVGLQSLHVAIRAKNESVLKQLIVLLLQFRKKIDILDDNSDTPLDLAIKNRWFEGILILIEMGKVDVNISKPEFRHMMYSLSLNRSFILINYIFQFANSKNAFEWERYHNIYRKFSISQKEELQRIAPISESFEITLAGHVWGLEGVIVTGQLKSSFEGVFHSKYIAEQIFQEFKSFMEINRRVAAFQQMFNDKFFENLEFFLKPVMGKPIDAIDLIKTGGPVSVHVRAHGHAFYLVLKGDWLYLCNRGNNAGVERKSGALRFYIKEPIQSLPQFLKDLNGAEKTDRVFHICDKYIDQNSERNIGNNLSVTQSQQNHGNCPSASFKSALLALLIETTQDVPAAKKIYKKFTTHLRERMLDRLLALPSKYTKIPLDQIRRKINKSGRWNQEQKRGMIVKIAEWSRR